MSAITINPFRGKRMESLSADLGGAEVISDPTAARQLINQCPAAGVTPLRAVEALAAELGVSSIDAKDERGRMGLGSFKALGAAHAIAKQAAADASGAEFSKALEGVTYVCASAGNHGLSVAAGARVFGADAVIYLSATVPDEFAERLREKGARVVREGADYEESMTAAMAVAEHEGWLLLSDSSWPGYVVPARDVMEGYLVMAAEVGEQIAEPPTHIFLQAGVGGLAAACTVHARRIWGDAPKICVVEPEHAPALKASIAAGKVVNAPGPISAMGRLDCKEPSLLALDALARDADAFMTVTEEQAAAAVARSANHGIASSPSGAAGLAGLVVALDDDALRRPLQLTSASRVLLYISEGPVDD